MVVGYLLAVKFTYIKRIEGNLDFVKAFKPLLTARCVLQNPSFYVRNLIVFVAL